MSKLKFLPLPSQTVHSLQAGQPDANGQTPERHISDGDGVPCRHCLQNVAAGDPYLILSHRPFPAPQPYAEQGPIFLHADGCAPYATPHTIPPMYLTYGRLLIRAYSSNNRIIYGTGQIVTSAELTPAAETLFQRSEVAYIHIRSATNNCYQCRIERASAS